MCERWTRHGPEEQWHLSLASGFGLALGRVRSGASLRGWRRGKLAIAGNVKFPTVLGALGQRQMLQCVLGLEECEKAGHSCSETSVSGLVRELREQKEMW